ncbi:MAG: prolipoprotein diacylglyceryl transferase [Deltaproteobacteria bacterium]|nr:prolipoprotein diacylglyceryl transferase [Deltaproteobacteria bacterium]
MHPILISFGPIEIRYYGLMYVVAIIVGSYLLKSEVKRKGISLSEDESMNLLLWVMLGGIIGARLYYVAFNLEFYIDNIKEIPAVWHGGLAIHGGIIGGIFSGWVFVRKHSVPFWYASDACAPVLILGQTFGRFGNFMNGDAHGVPTDLPWGIVFPPESIAGREFPGIATHPVMLYEMALNFLIFSLLWFVLRKRNFKSGFIFATYFVLYSFGRFIVESFRADSLMMWGFRTAQVISIALIIITLAIIIYKKLWQNEPQRSSD